MRTLTKWSARRAGNCLVVFGTDESGREVKLAGIDVVGVDRDGAVYAMEGPGRARAAGRPQTRVLLRDGLR